MTSDFNAILSNYVLNSLENVSKSGDDSLGY